MGRLSLTLMCLAACFTTQPSEALFSKKPEAARSCSRDNPLTPLPLRLRRLSRKSPAPPFANLKLDCDVECSHCALQARGGFMGTTEAATEATARVVEKSFVNWMPLNAWKALMQVALTSINVVCWLVPLRSKNFSSNKLMLSLANAFSGGVFLSLAFGHLIPECIQGFNELPGERNEVLPFMMVLFGYLLIFFVEKVAFDAHGLMENMEEGGGAKAAGAIPTIDDPNTPEQTPLTPAQSPQHPQDATGHSARSAVILLGALAVHSVLEMAALGLAGTFADSALLSLSIALHQPAESIALLVAFLKSGMEKSEIIKCLSIFSVMGPIGVVLGMVVKQVAPPVVDALMLATVAGTFIYVGATEVIPEEWEDQEHKWKKFGALMFGIVSIFGITQYTAGLEGAHAQH